MLRARSRRGAHEQAMHPEERYSALQAARPVGHAGVGYELRRPRARREGRLAARPRPRLTSLRYIGQAKSPLDQHCTDAAPNVARPVA